MKAILKLFVVAMITVLTLIDAASSAAAINVTTGDTKVVLKYNFQSYTSMDIGQIKIDDSNNIIKEAKIESVNFSAKDIYGVQFETYDEKIFMTSPNGPVNGTIKVVVKINQDAQEGETATVSLVGGYSCDGFEYRENTWNKTIDIVKQTPQKTVNNSDKKPNTNTKKEDSKKKNEDKIELSENKMEDLYLSDEYQKEQSTEGLLVINTKQDTRSFEQQQEEILNNWEQPFYCFFKLNKYVNKICKQNIV